MTSVLIGLHFALNLALVLIVVCVHHEMALELLSNKLVILILAAFSEIIMICPCVVCI
jgi:hypothetical protein